MIDEYDVPLDKAFTEAEAARLLGDYQLEGRLTEMKEWYDGYRFGDEDIYCPWDVVSYVDRLSADPHAEPEAFWINTNGNELVKRFIDKADRTAQNEIERLVAGEAIEKRAAGGIYKLVIPNREVKEVFVLKIQEWFKESIAEDEKPIHEFCRAFLEGRAEDIQKQLNVILNRMFSVMDTKAPDARKENFYHGLLLGLLRSETKWLILSNAESGDGFSDILIEPETQMREL